jgi:hypothetical protein
MNDWHDEMSGNPRLEPISRPDIRSFEDYFDVNGVSTFTRVSYEVDGDRVVDYSYWPYSVEDEDVYSKIREKMREHPNF